MDEKFMRRAIELAKAAESHDEVPVGAVVVYNGEIVGEGENRKERENNALAHAEMVALDNAVKKLGWMLCDCDLYVTLEPCPMCAGAMVNSRIKNLYFGAYDEKSGCAGSVYNIVNDKRFNHRINTAGGIMRDECAALLTDFFKKKRG